ncbi:MAG: hypothetical protein AAGF30_12660 [Pseudomonadota bacterium]
MLTTKARANRALIVSLEAIEAIDIDEFLVAKGWDPSVVVQTADQARRMLMLSEQTMQAFSLAVFGLNANSPDLGPFLDICAEQAVRVLHLNGETKLEPADNISTLARPFTTQDLDASLRALGFLELNGHEI